jgi:tetratricopeptide (TPR) repeat protein
LACIYTAAKNYELAKGWLDRLDGDSSIFPRRKELAVLYTQIANALRRQNKLKPAIECLKLAGEYYARCQMWHDFCLVNLTRAQLLIDAGYVERSLSVANKILAASFNLDYDPIAVAKIFNDLSTIFAIDPYGLENIRYSRKLLKKALRIVQENQRADLEIFVYLNLAAISNQLENFDSALRYLELAYTLIDSQSNSQSSYSS